VPIDTETLILLVIIFLAVIAYTNNGVWSTDNPLVWGPAMLIYIPFALFNSIAAAFPLIVPIAVVALLAYWNFLGDTLGMPLVTLAIIGTIIVMLGV